MQNSFINPPYALSLETPLTVEDFFMPSITHRKNSIFMLAFYEFTY